jgi:hypothetical protein
MYVLNNDLINDLMYVLMYVLNNDFINDLMYVFNVCCECMF